LSLAAPDRTASDPSHPFRCTNSIQNGASGKTCESVAA
jgi:hypothetical protein